MKPYQLPAKPAPKEAVEIIETLVGDGYVLRGQKDYAAASISKLVKRFTVREIAYSPETIALKQAELAAKESARITFLNAQKQKTERVLKANARNAEFSQAFVTASKQVLNRDEFMAIVDIANQAMRESGESMLTAREGGAQ